MVKRTLKQRLALRVSISGYAGLYNTEQPPGGFEPDGVIYRMTALRI